MTKKQFAKLLDVLKGIEEALQQLRLQNRTYIPYVPYTYEYVPDTTPSEYPYYGSTSYGPIAKSQSEQNQ
jgi:hypothetical protein